ncbi:MAG: cytochrome c biogenesis CcdA family protein [Patescibacteria group bacterium]
MLFDGSNVNLAIAFAGGLITFFASCLLPLVPTYLAYLSGITTSDIYIASSEKKRFYKKELFLISLFFTLGFIFVFVLLGASASKVANTLAVNRNLFQKIGGGFFVVMGLVMLGKFKFSFFQKEYKLSFSTKFLKWHKLNSFLTGITFGFAWTPCIGPVLAVILFWASQAGTTLKGMLLLLTYGLGIGVPFLLIGIFFEYLAPRLSLFSKYGYFMNKAASVFIIIMGVLMLINKVEFISITLLRLFNLNTLST